MGKVDVAGDRVTISSGRQSSSSRVSGSHHSVGGQGVGAGCVGHQAGHAVVTHGILTTTRSSGSALCWETDITIMYAMYKTNLVRFLLVYFSEPVTVKTKIMVKACKYDP
jgi:hypothetical protein